MSRSIPFFRTSIRLTVLSVFLLGTVITAGVALYFQYFFSETMARRAAADLYSTTADNIANELRGLNRVYENVASLLAGNALLAMPGNEDRLLQTFTSVLEDNPLLYGLYVGRDDGSLTEVINLQNAAAHEYGDAEASDRWLLITVSGETGPKRRTIQYLGADLSEQKINTEVTSYSATERDWYQSALSSDKLEISAPYEFAQSGVMGQTLSRKFAASEAVLGIDLTLETLSSFLRSQSIASDSQLFIFNGDGRVIASSDNLRPAIIEPATKEIAEQMETAHAGALKTLSGDLMASIIDKSSQRQLHEISLDDEAFALYATALGSESNIYLGILTPEKILMAPFREKILIAIVGTGIALMLLLPMSWLLAGPIVNPVRQLAKENNKARRLEFDEVERVISHIREIDELSASMVDMVDAIKGHEAAQRELIDAVIRLIAQAIDDKSAYTGGHCARVPELAMMLARAAHTSSAPAFQDFHFDSDEEWREYRIAAWLHDCGKITTPEHVVDKGSKLEMIYNRIHEVRMRFEVLSRDAELQFWEQLAERPRDRDALGKALEAEQDRLRSDFEFVAQCNVGGESLDPEDLTRLASIAGRTWQRRFDNRLGLSPQEEAAGAEETQELPAIEYLLADKPEHIVARDQELNFDPRLGIDMTIPENLYNHGELYNLSVAKGTLTAEERFKINEHMISTIKMLESLPFPGELEKVPRYASTHHETLDGKGYPRRLTGDQLTIPERILAIADVFEALTAADRPYKKAKSINSSIAILHGMVNKGHLDRDCFELFLKSGVYRAYADRYLDQAQIDHVDIDRFLAG